MIKVAVLAIVVPMSVCFAQADRAAITGTILDPTNSVVPLASVTVTYSTTGLLRKTMSSAAGVFHLGELPIGTCYVQVEASGFRPVKTAAFELSVGETRTLDVSLDLSSLGSTVEVQSVADGLTYSTVSVSSVTSSQQLNELPVNGRNWQSFMALAPGAVDGANGGNTAVRFFATSATTSTTAWTGSTPPASATRTCGSTAAC